MCLLFKECFGFSLYRHPSGWQPSGVDHQLLDVQWPLGQNHNTLSLPKYMIQMKYLKVFVKLSKSVSSFKLHCNPSANKGVTVRNLSPAHLKSWQAKKIKLKLNPIFLKTNKPHALPFTQIQGKACVGAIAAIRCAWARAREEFQREVFSLGPPVSFYQFPIRFCPQIICLQLPLENVRKIYGQVAKGRIWQW